MPTNAPAARPLPAMLCWPRRIDEGFTLAEDWDTQSLIRCPGAFRSDFRTCRRRTSGAKKAGTFAFAWVTGLRWILWSFNWVASIELDAGTLALQWPQDTSIPSCPQSCPQKLPDVIALRRTLRSSAGVPRLFWGSQNSTGIASGLLWRLSRT